MLSKNLFIATMSFVVMTEAKKGPKSWSDRIDKINKDHAKCASVPADPFKSGEYCIRDG